MHSILRTAALLVGTISLASFAQAHGESVPGPAQAPGDGDASDERARARESFKRGVAFARSAQWVDALRELRQSQETFPHPVTEYNIAFAERALGHYTRALATFTQALSARAPGEPTLPPDLETQARAYLSAVQGRVVRVAVSVGPHVTALAVDGAPLAVWNDRGSRVVMIGGTRDEAAAEPPPARSFDMVLDPGRHVIVVSLAGQEDDVVTVSFAPGSDNTLSLEGSDASTAPTATTVVEPSTTTASTRDAESTAPIAAPAADAGATSTDRTWAWVSFGVAGAGAIAGTAFLVSGLERDAELANECPGGACPNEAPYPDKLDALRRDEVLMFVGYGMAVAGAGVGTLLWLTASGSSEDVARSSTPTVRPCIGLRSVGVTGSF